MFFFDILDIFLKNVITRVPVIINIVIKLYLDYNHNLY